MGRTALAVGRAADMIAVMDSAASRSDMSTYVRRLLVVSGDPERRERWAAVLAETGYDVARCAGPAAASCAIVDGRRCPLLEEADLALYDTVAYVPRLARVLGRQHGYRASVLVAQDDADGRPAAVRRNVVTGPGCFGSAD